MARRFTAASAQYLTSGTVPDPGQPCTLFAWWRAATIPGAGLAYRLFNYSALNLIEIRGFYIDSQPIVILQEFSNAAGGVNAFANSSIGSYTTGVWYPIMGTFAPSSRTLYFNGEVVNNPAVLSPVGLNTFNVGRRQDNNSQHFDGDVAECAAWNVILTADEFAALSAGVSPSLIRPASLIGYWPLLGGFSPEIDLVGRNDLIVTGATPSGTHPRTFQRDVMPPPARWGAPLGAAGRTLATFGPEHADLLPVGSMMDAIRNGHRVLEALAGAAESATFVGVLPRTAYVGGRISVTLYWLAKTATTGTAGWDVTVERDNAANHDLDADAWVAIVATPLVVVDPIAGTVMATTVTLTPSADLESIAAGDPFRLRVRSLAPGTATGNTQLLAVEMRAT